MLGKNSKRRWEGNCCPEKKGDGRSKLMLAPRMQCAACASALRSAPESLAACSIHLHLEFLPVQLYCSLCQRARGSLLVTSEQVCGWSVPWHYPGSVRLCSDAHTAAAVTPTPCLCSTLLTLLVQQLVPTFSSLRYCSKSDSQEGKHLTRV